MCVLKKVVGNVYFCDFETAVAESPTLTLVPAVVSSTSGSDIRLMAVQINIALKEIIATQTAIARHSDELSHDLYSMLSVIDSIVCETGMPAVETQTPEAREKLELMQSAATLANDLLMLVRDRALHTSAAAHRLADFRRHSSLLELTVA